jgi:hypothetical protein
MLFFRASYIIATIVQEFGFSIALCNQSFGGNAFRN